MLTHVDSNNEHDVFVQPEWVPKLFTKQLLLDTLGSSRMQAPKY